MRVENGKVVLGPLKEEAIKEYKEKAQQRKEILRRLWRLLDLVGEQEIITMIEELEKKLR